MQITSISKKTHISEIMLHFDCSNICELFDSCNNTDSALCKDCVSGQPYCGVSKSHTERGVLSVARF